MCSTYRELLSEGKHKLREASCEEADTDSWLLLSYLTDMKRADFFLKQDDPVPERERIQYRQLIEKRSLHIPLQYITGEQEFMGLPFLVNEHVLIPRQDTELLVEHVLPYVSGKKVLDLCTGSGCIAVSLAALGNPEFCLATDLSKQALAVAKENAERNHVKVSFLESDLFEGISGIFDVIVSNPPYIPGKRVEELMEEVREHEPRNALDGGEDGLSFYRKIIKESIRFLEPKGMLFFEIGYDQADAVKELMEAAGYIHIDCKKDYAGLDRIVFGQNGGE